MQASNSDYIKYILPSIEIKYQTSWSRYFQKDRCENSWLEIVLVDSSLKQIGNDKHCYSGLGNIVFIEGFPNYHYILERPTAHTSDDHNYFN